MDFDVKFDFHKVGQGLFYTGKISRETNDGEIRDFNFVYDCGSQKRKKTEDPIDNYKDPIDNYKKENLKNNTIDLLVISHFDGDHIDGLDYLLNNDVKIKCAIIPYCPPCEKLLLVLRNREYPDDVLQIMANPVKYLDEMNVEKIILIAGSQYNGRSFDEEYFKNGKIDPEISKYHSENKVEIIFQEDDVTEILEEVFGEEDGVLLDYWHFKFFYNRMHNDKLGDFEDCLITNGIDLSYQVNSLINYIENDESRKIIEESDYLPNFLLVELIRNKSFRDKIKKCYEDIIIHLPGYGRERLNLTSLAMYHGPTRSYTKTQYGINSSDLTLTGPVHSFREDDGGGVGHLLTGDINLNRNSASIHMFFRDCNEIPNRNEIAVFLIPHHGSLYNWDDNILTVLSDCNLWVASTGFSNQYTHPNVDIVSGIFKKKKLFGWCNELNKITVGGKLTIDKAKKLATSDLKH